MKNLATSYHRADRRESGRVQDATSACLAISFVSLACRTELDAAGIPCVHEDPFERVEVPSMLAGCLNGWTFRRAWYYWIARSETHYLPNDVAMRLQEAMGREVRADGDCACRGPLCWWSTPGNVADHYHVDSQAGLVALADAIRNHSMPLTADIWLARAASLEKERGTFDSLRMLKICDDMIAEYRLKAATCEGSDG